MGDMVLDLDKRDENGDEIIIEEEVNPEVVCGHKGMIWGDMATYMATNARVNKDCTDIEWEEDAHPLLLPNFTIIFTRPVKKHDQPLEATIKGYRYIKMNDIESKCLANSLYFVLYPDRILSVERDDQMKPLLDTDGDTEKSDMEKMLSK